MKSVKKAMAVAGLTAALFTAEKADAWQYGYGVYGHGPFWPHDSYFSGAVVFGVPQQNTYIERETIREVPEKQYIVDPHAFSPISHTPQAPQPAVNSQDLLKAAEAGSMAFERGVDKGVEVYEKGMRTGEDVGRVKAENTYLRVQNQDLKESVYRGNTESRVVSTPTPAPTHESIVADKKIYTQVYVEAPPTQSETDVISNQKDDKSSYVSNKKMDMMYGIGGIIFGLGLTGGTMLMYKYIKGKKNKRNLPEDND